MALNKLKKWIGTQAMTAFFDRLNDNVDATNAAIDLAETNSATVASLIATQGAAKVKDGTLPESGSSDTVALPGYGIYLLVTQRQIQGQKASLDIIAATGSIFSITNILTHSATEITYSGLALTITHISTGVVKYNILRISAY